MKPLIKAIITSLTSLLFFSFIIQLFFGVNQDIFLLKNPLGFLIIFFPDYITIFVIGFIFASNRDIIKKRKFIKITSIAGVVSRLPIIFVLFGIGGMDALRIGVVEILALMLLTVVLNFFVKLEDRKQNLIVYVSFLIFLILNIIQYFGFLVNSFQQY